MALHAARPRVTTDGKIELECDTCAGGARRPPVAAIESPIEQGAAAPRRRRPAMFAVAAGGAVLALVSLFGAGGERTAASAARPTGWHETTSPSTSSVGLDLTRDLTEFARAERIEIAGTPPPPPELPPMPERDGEPVDSWYPTLQGWVHPVPGSPDVIPHRHTRVFGAHRPGVSRRECGAGHCGVDLEGERGQPVIAVAWGTVRRIQRDPNGRGGRYVKIEHPDFVYSSYFHLDAIAPGLAVGDELEPGAPVGTLGRSGIHISMPHLHFALELPDGAAVRFVDPVPFLARAEVLARDAVPELDVKPPVDPEPEAVPVIDPGFDTASETSPEAEPPVYRSVTGAVRP